MDYKHEFASTSSGIIKECIEGLGAILRKLIIERDLSKAPYSTSSTGISITLNDVFIAGGSIKDFLSNSAIKDLDVFFQTKEQALMYLAFFTTLNNVKILADSPNSCTVSWLYTDEFGKTTPLILDFIKVRSGSPTDVISSFDFTVCSAAVTAHSAIFHKNYFQDLFTKNLAFNTIPDLSGIRRILKYVRKGYCISEEELSRFFEYNLLSGPEGYLLLEQLKSTPKYPQYQERFRRLKFKSGGDNSPSF